MCLIYVPFTTSPEKGDGRSTLSFINQSIVQSINPTMGRRLLLTQSQVTVVLSFAAITLCTLAIFLSGYVLQQRTLTHLQASLKPRLPPQQHQFQVPTSTITTTSAIPWHRLAHLTMAPTQPLLCRAIMIHAALHAQKSPARRILLFPHSWAAEPENARDWAADPFLASTHRLLRLAARRYGVELRPISPVRPGGEDYSLASAFALVEFEKVMVLAGPGLVVDAERLDGVLAFGETTAMATNEGGLTMLDTTNMGHLLPTDLILLQPNLRTHSTLLNALANHTSNTTAPHDLPTSFLPSPPTLLPLQSPPLIHSLASLHESDVNATAFATDPAYVLFRDPALPEGPEVEVPWSARMAARPKRKEADWEWTRLYGEFAQRRWDVCGVGLEGGWVGNE